MADSAHFMERIRGYTRQQQEEALWETMTALAGNRFYTAKNLEYTYRVRGGEMFVDRKEKSITQATVFIAFHRALELGQRATGPKTLGTFGASYLYPIFQSLGIVPGRKKSARNTENCGKSPGKAKKIESLLKFHKSKTFLKLHGHFI